MELLGGPENGRPAGGGRSEIENKTYDLLDSLGVAYTRVDTTPAENMEDCVFIEEVLGAPVFKNLFLCNRQMTEFYLMLIDSKRPFRTAVVSKLLGVSRLSFGTPEKLKELLGLTPGSVSVFGLMNDGERRVRLAVDKKITEYDRVGAHPCVNTSTVGFSVNDLMNVIIPYFGREPVILDLDAQL